MQRMVRAATLVYMETTTEIINATRSLTPADCENILAIIAKGEVGKGLIRRKGSPARYSVTSDGEWFDVLIVPDKGNDSGHNVPRRSTLSFQTR